MTKKKIRYVIDPGHGTPDPGAVGKGGLQEQAVNLAVGLKLTELLKAAKKDVIITRSDDKLCMGEMPARLNSMRAVINMSLRHRVDLCRRPQAGLFISIHCNAAESRRAHGFEVFHNNAGKAEAHKVYAALKKAMPEHRARRCERARYYVLRKNPAPAMLVELEFISNPEMEELLAASETVDMLAAALAAAI